MLTMAYPEVFKPGEEEFNSDAWLVGRALENDLAAFEQLVERYQGKMVGYAARMLNDSEEAEDVAQEVFIKAYRSLDSFRGDSAFSTWIYRIATNLCIDRMRKRKRSPQQAYSLDEPLDREEEKGSREIPDESGEPNLNMERQELREQVRLVMSGMPDKMRTVLVLCDIQGLPYEQISKILKCPIGTVKSRLFHARADLGRRLRPYISGVQ